MLRVARPSATNELGFEGEGVDKKGIVDSITGDKSSAVRETLGWVPEITVQQMCAEMVAEDLKVAQRHALLKAHGHDIHITVE